MNSLHRLVYCSRNRLSGSPADIGSSIRSILASSRRNNEAVGITGALMFNAGCFAQLLEGPRAMLESTFDRIQLDDRHGDVSLLAFEAADERLFSQWSMGFVGGREDDAARFADVADTSGFDPSAASGEEVLHVLRRVALEEEHFEA